MQVAIDTRTVDKDRLFHISAGRIVCSLALRLMLVLKDSRVHRIPSQYLSLTVRSSSRCVLSLPAFT